MKLQLIAYVNKLTKSQEYSRYAHEWYLISNNWNVY